MEDSRTGMITADGASVMRAENEEDALSLLFVGDTNRVVCDTPNNECSSRSHCVFSIFIDHQCAKDGRVRRSKLNLVDLAGSERVYKSQVSGNVLDESKSINLALHFLESVIVALNNNASHIPYRNSKITSYLRDSLGGNCRTAMLACVSLSEACVNESIYTLRFSQRVARIRNKAIVNAEMDPFVLIESLKNEVNALKQRIAELTQSKKNGEDVDDNDSKTDNNSNSKESDLLSLAHSRINELESQLKMREQEVGSLMAALQKYRAKEATVKIHPIAQKAGLSFDEQISRNDALIEFKKQSETWNSVRKMHQELKEKIERAKQVRELVTNSQQNVSDLRIILQKILTGDIVDDEVSEEHIKEEIMSESQKYGESVNELKSLKVQITHCQSVIAAQRQRLQREFEVYWDQLQQQQREE